MLSTLPDNIKNEIFTLSSIVGDVVIDYLCGILEDLDYVITSVDNYDSALIIHLKCESIIAELRIDRILRQFEIAARYADYTIWPRCGSWGDILEYLMRLRAGM